MSLLGRISSNFRLFVRMFVCSFDIAPLCRLAPLHGSTPSVTGCFSLVFAFLDSCVLLSSQLLSGFRTATRWRTCFAGWQLVSRLPSSPRSPSTTPLRRTRLARGSEGSTHCAATPAARSAAFLANCARPSARRRLSLLRRCVDRHKPYRLLFVKALPIWAYRREQPVMSPEHSFL